MSNEVNNFYKNYANIKNGRFALKVASFGISKQERDNLLNNWLQFEKPDIINKTQGCIYGIEHFEYDAYKNNKNGSTQRKEYSTINKSINEEVKKKIKDKAVITSYREIISRPKINDYKDSFIKSFEKHYSSIPNYKKHLSQIDKSYKVSIWFLAEDVTPLGSHFFYNNKKSKPSLKPVTPLFLPEIKELFLNNNDLDGIIFADSYYKIISICKRNKESVSDLIKAFDYNDESFEFFNPKIISTTIKV